MSLYRPHIDRACATYEQVVNRHAEDLAIARLDWEEKIFTGPDGETLRQYLPVIFCEFKGAV